MHSSTRLPFLCRWLGVVALFCQSVHPVISPPSSSVRSLQAVPAEGSSGGGSEESVGGRWCFDVPVATSESCTKTEVGEQAFSCPKIVEKHVCGYEEVQVEDSCATVVEVKQQWQCLKRKEIQKCWREPHTVEKKCSKKVRRQEAYLTEKVTRREKCQSEQYEVLSPCHLAEEESVAYMCYKRGKETTHCTTPDTSVCSTTTVSREPYTCEGIVYEANCSSSTRKIRPEGSGGSPYCPVGPVRRAQTCHRDVTHSQIDQDCVRKLQDQAVCSLTRPLVPGTCRKTLPTLRTTTCPSLRSREVCEEVETAEAQPGYREVADVTEYDCPTVEWRKVCKDFAIQEMGVCTATLLETNTEKCPRTEMKMTCRVVRSEEPHTCFRDTPVEKQLQCVRVQYSRTCLREGGEDGGLPAAQQVD